MAQIGKNITLAKQLLKQGQVVAIPTETVYGLAANAYDIQAVEKIFLIKNRPHTNPLIVHVATLNQVQDLVIDMPPAAKKLAKFSWPGPLTLLLPKKEIVPNLVTAGSSQVAVRIPNHPITLALLKALTFPLAGPSANPFGYISPTQSIHVYQHLGDKIPYILEGGECSVGLESTIVGFEAGHPIIYRLGGLTVEKIEEITALQPRFYSSSHAPHKVARPTPGLFLQHYAPIKPLYVGNITTLLAEHAHQLVGVLAFNQYAERIPIAQQVLLAPNGTLEEAAYSLFAALHILDQMTVDCIVCDYLPFIGLGKAINERLLRASTTRMA